MKSILQKLFLLHFLLFWCLVASQPAFGQRIISLGPINTENVYALGAGDRLVANTNYCVRPEAAKNKEKIGSVLLISIEKIISLHPDLVLATALTRPDQIRQLEAVGIEVVRFRRAANFSEICTDFIRLGELLGLETRALEIVGHAQAEVARINKAVAGLARPKVFIQIGANPLFGAVSNSFTHDFITLGGGLNIIDDQKKGTTSFEKVITQNPDVIIIGIMGSESGIAAEQKRKWQKVSVMQAVQENRVHIIHPDLICSPSPITFAQTLKVITGFLHPEVELENVNEEWQQ